MTTVIDLSVERSVMLNLGRVGENDITDFIFDYTNWAEEFGEGTLSLVLKRQGDAEGYPKAMTSADSQSTWVVDSTDVANEGIGEAQLTYTVDNEIKKSVIYLTRTCPSIEPVGPAPDPYQSWLDQMIEAGEDAEDAAERAEAAASTWSVTGTYPDMAVGNILSTSPSSDSDPYYSRISHGIRVDDEIVGGSLPWNQIVQNGDFASKSGWSCTNASWSVANNIATLPLVVNEKPKLYKTINEIAIADHKYVLLCDFRHTTANTGELRFGVASSSSGGTASKAYSVADIPVNTWTTLSLMRNGSSSLKYFFIGIITSASAGVSSADSWDIRNMMVIDLTLLFGSTIADYLYTLEQGTAGAGVAFFRSLFPKSYYAYDAGSMQSVQVAGRKIVRFNLWDGEAESGYIDTVTGGNAANNSRYRSKNYIPVFPNTTYYVRNSDHAYANTVSIRLFYYDASNNFLSSPSGASASRTFTTPDNCYYLRFFVNEALSNFDNTICINVSNPQKNGTYEPYTTTTYPLSNIELRGLFKISNGELYCDGDTYESNGTVTRNWYECVATECAFAGTASTGVKYVQITYSSDVPSPVPESSSNGFLSDRYMFSANAPDTSGWFRVMPLSSGMAILIFDNRFTDKTTADSILASEKPHFLYRVATPTTESADSFTNPQIVYDGGTETYLDGATRDIEMPVGHNSKYYPDMVGFLSQIPEAPSANGVYTLKATVNNGAVTYAWTS